MLIECINIDKTFSKGSIKVDALKNVNVSIKKGSFVAIIGPSGSGKSTLMNILGCLDKPTKGKYILDGINVSKRKLSALADIRNRKIGYIFQNFNLLARYNLFANVELPLIYSGMTKKKRRSMVMEAIELVGLRDRIKHRPSELSGGQCQRVAIARALVNKPSIILADEPTGNLDSKTGKEIIQIFKNLILEKNTIIIVTHDQDVAKNAKNKITISDGIVKQVIRK